MTKVRVPQESGVITIEIRNEVKTFPVTDHVVTVEEDADVELLCGRVTGAEVEGGAPVATPDGAFDPGAHTVTEVTDYVRSHPDLADAVIAAERAGKSRSTLLTVLADLNEDTLTAASVASE